MTTLKIRMKRMILPIVVAVGVLAISFSAMAKYIPNIDWAHVKCANIPQMVDRLHNLADYLQDRANEADAQGNEGLADAYEAAAMEATIEAAEGTFHYSSGDCIQ